MSQAQYDPAIMAMLDDAKKFISSESRTTERFKVEKNEQALIRIVPTEMGAKRYWFAPIAQHWIGRRPHFCVTKTPPEFGGDPNTPCIICQLADHMNQQQDKAISTEGFRAMSNFQYSIWILVRAFTHKGNWIQNEQKQWDAVEFPISRPAFEKLIQLFQNNIKPGTKSIVDAMVGNDLILAADKRGFLTFDRQDSSPIIPGDPSTPEWLQTWEYIFSKIKPPRYQPLKPEYIEKAKERLQEAVLYRRKEMAKEGAKTAMGGGGVDDFIDWGGGGSVDESSDEGSDFAPSAPSAPPMSAPSPVAPPTPMAAPAPAPAAPAPAPMPAAAPRKTVPPPPASAAPKPPAPVAPKPAAAPARPTAPPIPTTAPVAPPVAQVAPPVPTHGEQSDLDEDDNVTDEVRDYAPVSQESVEDAPPPVAPTPSATPTPPVPAAPKGNLTSRLMSGITAAKDRQ